MIDDALREELSALLDGVLPEDRARELRRRIREEPELFREYASLERAVQAVRSLPRKGAPPELRKRIRASIGGARPRGRILRLGGLAAAAVVLLGLGIALYVRREPPVHFEAKGDRDERQDAPASPTDVRSGGAGAETDQFGQPSAESLDRAQDKARAEIENALAERRGAPKKAAPADLVASVEQTRTIPASDRKAYLRQLATLKPDKARAHLLAVFGGTGKARLVPPGRDTTVLATILLADREEATLVKKILGSAPPAELAAASVEVEEAKKDELSTEVSGTPTELWSIDQWLTLLDLEAKTMKRSTATVFGETKSGAKEQAPPVRTATVRLRFGRPPGTEPKEAPPSEK